MKNNQQEKPSDLGLSVCGKKEELCEKRRKLEKVLKKFWKVVFEGVCLLLLGPALNPGPWLLIWSADINSRRSLVVCWLPEREQIVLKKKKSSFEFF